LTVEQTDIQNERNLVVFVHIFSKLIVDVYNLFFTPLTFLKTQRMVKLRQQRIYLREKLNVYFLVKKRSLDIKKDFYGLWLYLGWKKN